MIKSFKKHFCIKKNCAQHNWQKYWTTLIKYTKVWFANGNQKPILSNYS